MKTDHILFAYELDGGGRGKPLKGQEIADCIEQDRLGWVHFDGSHGDTRKWLEKKAPYLDDVIIDALLAEETRPRVAEYGEGMMVILRGVNLNEDAEAEDMISIRVWVDPHRIISTQRRPLKAVQDIHLRLDEGKGPKNSAEFIVALCTRLFQRMEPTILDLDERTDSIEEKILDDPDIRERHEIVDIRKMAIILRRYIAPQKDVLAAMRTSELPWLDSKHRRQLQENMDRVTRYVEDLDSIRDRAQVVKDELASTLADRLNKNMYVLSIIAAIFLPLGFVTGLLGINVGGMPGADNDLAFWIVCGLCAVFLALQFMLFRFLRWI